MHPSFPGLFHVIFLAIAKRRPRWLLFVLGALMIAPVGLAGMIAVPIAGLFDDLQTQLFVIAFAGSSLPEELMRYAALYYVGMRWFGITRVRDGLIFGLLVSFGFSCAENIYYALSIGWATGILKLALATPIHLALGVTMGCLLAMAVTATQERKRFYFVFALAAPALTHGVYDLVLLTALTDGGANIVSRLALPVIIYVLVVTISVLVAMLARHRVRITPATA